MKRALPDLLQKELEILPHIDRWFESETNDGDSIPPVTAASVPVAS
jgi:hypothetical protein